MGRNFNCDPPSPSIGRPYLAHYSILIISSSACFSCMKTCMLLCLVALLFFCLCGFVFSLCLVLLFFCCRLIEVCCCELINIGTLLPVPWVASALREKGVRKVSYPHTMSAPQLPFPIRPSWLVKWECIISERMRF